MAPGRSHPGLFLTHLTAPIVFKLYEDQWATDPRPLSRNTTFSDTASAFCCACIHRDQGSVLVANRRVFQYASLPDHNARCHDLEYSPEKSRRPILVLIPGPLTVYTAGTIAVVSYSHNGPGISSSCARCRLTVLYNTQPEVVPDLIS